MEKNMATKIRTRDLYPGEGPEWNIWRQVKTAQAFQGSTKQSQAEIIEKIADKEEMEKSHCTDLFNQAEEKYTTIRAAYAKAKLELRQEGTSRRFGHYSPEEENLIRLTMMVHWDKSILDNVKTLLRLMPHRTKDGIRNQIYLLSKKGDKVEDIIAAVDTSYEKPVLDAEVMKIFDFGAIIRLADGERGFIHISNIVNARVEAVEDYFYPGQWIKVTEVAPDNKGRRQFSTKELGSAKYMDAEERKAKVSVTAVPFWNPAYLELYAEQHRQYEQAKPEQEAVDKVPLPAESLPKIQEPTGMEVDLVTDIYDSITIATERLEAVKEMLITLMDNVDELVKKGVKDELERMAKQYK